MQLGVNWKAEGTKLAISSPAGTTISRDKDDDNIGVQPAMKIDISKLSYLSGNGTYDSPIKFK